MKDAICHWLKDRVCHHRVEILAGLLLLIVELSLYFGSGVMLEETTNYHTGEGSWVEEQWDGANSFIQAFIPEYKNLASLSFLMDMEGVEQLDGEVTVRVSDSEDTILYEKALKFREISDGSFTDVDVSLKLSPRGTYYLTLVTTPSSAGEYPGIGLISKEYYLPENQLLIHEDEMSDVQLVSRYHYQDTLPFSKVRNIVFICVITALGVMFGLPDNKWVRRVVGIVLLVMAPYVLGSRLEMLASLPGVELTAAALQWNVGLMYAAEAIVLLCTHSPRITIVLTNTVLTLLYSVNYYVSIYRGTPLRVNDFTAIGTAAKVAGEYSFVPNDHMAFVWGLLILIAVFGIQTGAGRAEREQRRQRRSDKHFWVKWALAHVATVVVAAAVALYGGYQLIYTDMLAQAGFDDEEFKGFHHDLIYYMYGYLVGTCIEVSNSRITVLEGYSVDAVEGILSQAAEEQELTEEEIAKLPHVILIMNESFSDLRVLGDLDLNQENMSFFNSLQENTVRGYVNASVLGGGTANSEFEVFTGCSVAFFPVNYYPYQQAVRGHTESMVSQLQDYGYTTYSMHPEPSDNWNRNYVYKYFGFEHSLWKNDFAGAEVIHSGVSDEETFNRIIDIYENRAEGEKLFVWDLTMQNHANYFGKDEPYEVQSLKLQNPVIDEYLSLVKISDEAFEDLVEYFEKQDEKVIICMFGDHQPWISSKIVDVDKADPNLDTDKLMSMYKTPFVIWANYDIEEADGYDISMNYLGGVLLRTAGIPMSPYFTYLEGLREDYPIITMNGYVDSEGNYNSWSGDGNEFPEYRMLQYNCLFDDKRVEWGY